MEYEKKIYKNINKNEKAGTKKKLEENKENALLSKELAAINCISQIMAGTIFNKGNQVLARRPVCLRNHFIEQIAHHRDRLDVGRFTPAADIISLP